MDYIKAIIFGGVQGLAEFLPVSSSGHLVILHKFLKLPIENELAFDVALHLATFFAIAWFFRKDLIDVLYSWLNSLSGKKNEKSILARHIIIATIPAVLAGIFLEKSIESVLRSPLIVAAMLALFGIFFIIFEKISSKTDEIAGLNNNKSLLIGLSQAIALIPGVSRSGITIIAGLGAGLKREAAVKFSFLISVPVILGAALKEVPAIFTFELSAKELPILSVSFISAFIFGLLAIKYFMKIAPKYSLNVFAYYRFALAILIIIFFI